MCDDCGCDKENKTEAKIEIKDQKIPVQEIKKEEKTELQKKDDQIKDLTDTLKRVQAEFENYAKRVEKENAEFRKCAKSDLIKKLLTTIDSFEIALKNTQDLHKFKKGIEMIYAQLYQLLEEEGLKKIETAGKKFDPYYHEVLLTEHDNKKQEDEIIEELQKGYALNGKVLRYSKVKINKKIHEEK